MATSSNLACGLLEASVAVNKNLSQSPVGRNLSDGLQNASVLWIGTGLWFSGGLCGCPQKPVLWLLVSLCDLFGGNYPLV